MLGNRGQLEAFEWFLYWHHARRAGVIAAQHQGYYFITIWYYDNGKTYSWDVLLLWRTRTYIYSISTVCHVLKSYGDCGRPGSKVTKRIRNVCSLIISTSIRSASNECSTLTLRCFTLVSRKAAPYLKMGEKAETMDGSVKSNSWNPRERWRLIMGPFVV